MKIKVTQKKSSIGQKPNMIKTLEALGLKRIRHSVIHDDTPAIKGMIRTVQHLVEVEETKKKRGSKK